jgi:hypothetical protein
MNGRRIARYARPQSLSAKRLSAPVILRRRFSTRSTILQASATASAIAATYAGLFCGTVANFRAARIAATIAITACLRFGSTTEQYHFRFSLALHRHRLGTRYGRRLGPSCGRVSLVQPQAKARKTLEPICYQGGVPRPYSQYNLIDRSVTSETWSTGRNLSDLRRLILGETSPPASIRSMNGSGRSRMSRMISATCGRSRTWRLAYPQYVVEIKGADARYSKGIEWEHEREWRIIRNFNDAEQKVRADQYRKEVLLNPGLSHVQPCADAPSIANGGRTGITLLRRSRADGKGHE